MVALTMEHVVQCGLMILSAQAMLSTLGKFMGSLKAWVQTSAAICRSESRFFVSWHFTSSSHNSQAKESIFDIYVYN